MAEWEHMGRTGEKQDVVYSTLEELEQVVVWVPDPQQPGTQVQMNVRQARNDGRAWTYQLVQAWFGNNCQRRHRDRIREDEEVEG
jgi:hypothetical protein